MSASPTSALGRRERQIMDIVYRLGRASAADVLRELPDPPSYSAVRGMLRLLEDKEYLTHSQDGARYIYLPTTTRDEASRSALRHLLDTFFESSRESVVAALLNLSDAPVSKKEYRRLSALLDEAYDGEKTK